MAAFTEGIDKIYYDLDNIDDLKYKLHFEGKLKDTGKAVLPWAAAAALGYGIMTHDPQMSDQEKFDNASAIYQFTVINDQPDPDESAKQFVNLALTLPSKDRKRLKDSLENFKTNIPKHRRARMEEFQQSINYWVNQFNVDRWSQKDGSVKENNQLDSKFDQDVFNILDPLEAQIESGEYTQEEIVDLVTQDLATQLGTDISTEEGARIEQKVEHFYSMMGLDSIPADRRSRDYLDSRSAETASVVDENRPTGVPGSPFDDHARVPARVEGQPWVHSDDEFIFFLEWLLKKEWTARQIIDVVAKPYKPYVIEQYKEYLAHADRQAADPLL